jgi:hypothetical protein
MPADPIHPEQLDGERRFRADLAVYLDSLPVGELAEMLGELPHSRQQPLQVGVLMVALNERLPDALKLLPPAGQPGPGEGRRRSLRQVVADRRAARAARRAGPPPGAALQDWLATRAHGGLPAADPARERRLGEALRGHAAQREDQDERTAMGWQDPGYPPGPEPPAQGWWDWWLCNDH